MPHASGRQKGESQAAYEKRSRAVHINALEEVSRGITGGLVKQPYIGRVGKRGVNVPGSSAEPLDTETATKNRSRYGVEVKAKRRRKIAAMRSGG